MEPYLNFIVFIASGGIGRWLASVVMKNVGDRLMSTLRCRTLQFSVDSPLSTIRRLGNGRGEPLRIDSLASRPGFRLKVHENDRFKFTADPKDPGQLSFAIEGQLRAAEQSTIVDAMVIPSRSFVRGVLTLLFTIWVWVPTGRVVFGADLEAVIRVTMVAVGATLPFFAGILFLSRVLSMDDQDAMVGALDEVLAGRGKRA